MQNVFTDKVEEEVSFKEQWQQSRAMRVVMYVSIILILFVPELYDVWKTYTIEVRMVPLSQRGQPVATPTKRWHCTYD